MDNGKMSEERLNQKLDSIPPYARQVSEAMVALGQAVELALNMKDRAVIKEMESICLEIFEAAKKALSDDIPNLQ